VPSPRRLCHEQQPLRRQLTPRRVRRSAQSMAAHPIPMHPQNQDSNPHRPRLPSLPSFLWELYLKPNVCCHPPNAEQLFFTFL
jgi:hypothetical protein